MTLLFNKNDKDVVCAPTHHFCNLGCKMCHLTNNKLNKKMIPVNINDFIEYLYNTLTKERKRITNKEKLLISFMGVGEPLLNLNLILDVYNRIEQIKKDLNYNTIGFALSTMMPNNLVMLTEKIKENKMPLKVHFSLHTPIDEKRFDLLPSTRVTVKEALQYLNKYSNNFSNCKEFMDEYNLIHKSTVPIEIHYTLIDGVNDSDEELAILSRLLDEFKIPIKFITFNEINNLKRSKKIDIWIEKLKGIPGLSVKQYSPPGREIGSSCGEFTKHYYHEEIESADEKKEFEDFRKKHQVY